MTSIKFHLTDPVRLFIMYQNYTDYPKGSDPAITDILFEIGPIINRAKYGWSTYNLVLSSDISLDHKVSLLNDRWFSGSMGNLIIDYNLFKKYFPRFQVTEIQDRFYPLTEEDMLNDLDFMKDEITKIQIQMNIMKQKGENERYDFYSDLTSINMYKMFRFPNKEEFDLYVNKIRIITERDKKEMYDQRVNEMKVIENIIWN